MAQFNFLEKNVTSAALPTGGLRLLTVPGMGDLTATPSLWPVIGRLTGTFGERIDPFSGEAAFHTGVDISSQYGDAVRAAARGLLVNADTRAGYGLLVVCHHSYRSAAVDW